VIPARRISVAIVDDDAAVRAALRRLCEAFGWRAIAYASGREFLDSLAEESPDCVLLDAQMPGMAGLEVQSGMQERGVLVSTLVLTGSEVGDRDRYLAAGALEVLRKPIGDHELQGAVEAAVFGRSSR
jgi:FixJ family two-component response regulator